MYLEVQTKDVEKLKKEFEAQKINYALSVTNNQYRFDFPKLLPEDTDSIAKIDAILQKNLELENKPKGHYVNKWRETNHTIKEEIIGQFTGKATEEEFEYEN